ncbi:MAG: SDR family NAD(P)-dependent oxidoreductase [Planctomycetes bacterium]|nr:SDR family NAD(P)-dependent oxidoreductase [Planctomycetota bacterium]
MKTIHGRKALVTGAASGIGRGIAFALAREGVNLYLIDIDEQGLKNVADELKTFSIQVVVDRCDLTQPDDISRCLKTMLEHWSEIDILVNNAGLAYYGSTERISDEQWNRVMSVNLLAPIQITRSLLPVLMSRDEAHVLNVCSISGLVAGGRFAAYHTSKFGLVGFTAALRAEYGRKGLGVTALCPGPVLTNLYKNCQSSRSDRTVPSPPPWLCSSIDTVAKSAVKSIRKNQRQVLIGPLAHSLSWLYWLAPGLIDFLNRFSRQKKKRGQAAISTPSRKAA